MSKEDQTDTGVAIYCGIVRWNGDCPVHWLTLPQVKGRGAKEINFKGSNNLNKALKNVKPGTELKLKERKDGGFEVKAPKGKAFYKVNIEI